ncbi:unnamed protein product, partial [Closterium sp. Naga37s-1]
MHARMANPVLLHPPLPSLSSISPFLFPSLSPQPPPSPPAAHHMLTSVQALWDMQTSWGVAFDQWDTNGDCSIAYNISCNADGMVTWIDISGLNLGGPLPATIGDLAALSHL